MKYNYDFLKVLLLVAIVLGVTWSTEFILAIIEKVDEWSELIYHLGAGLGGVGLVAIGLYAVFGGLSRFERISLKIERERLDIQKQDHHRQKLNDHSIDTLEAFYRMKDAINRIRHPVTLRTELHELAAQLPEDSDLKDANGELNINILGLITLLRMQNEMKAGKKLDELRPRFNALYGDTSQFDEIFEIWRDIDITASSLLDDCELRLELERARKMGISGDVRSEALMSSDEIITKSKTIRSTLSDDDPIFVRMDEIIQRLRNTCNLN